MSQDLDERIPVCHDRWNIRLYEFCVSTQFLVHCFTLLLSYSCLSLSCIRLICLALCRPVLILVIENVIHSVSPGSLLQHQRCIQIIRLIIVGLTVIRWRNFSVYHRMIKSQANSKCEKDFIEDYTKWKSLENSRSNEKLYTTCDINCN